MRGVHRLVNGAHKGQEGIEAHVKFALHMVRVTNIAHSQGRRSLQEMTSSSMFWQRTGSSNVEG